MDTKKISSFGAKNFLRQPMRLTEVLISLAGATTENWKYNYSINISMLEVIPGGESE